MIVVYDGEVDVVLFFSLFLVCELFKVMCEVGFDVEFVEIGVWFDLKQGVEFVVYCILQEVFGNCFWYGGFGMSVCVMFKWIDQGFEVLVDDDGIWVEVICNGFDLNFEVQ